MYREFETITNPYKPESRAKSIVKNVLFVLLVAVITVIFVYLATHYAKPVHGASMQPTLNNDSAADRDIVIANKYATPSHGDIVIVDVSSIDSQYTGITDKNATLLIKRVIAMPGDRIRITYDEGTHETVVYLNGTKLNEDYIADSESYHYYKNYQQQTHWAQKIEPVNGEIILPENMIFCMGDNRDNSKDSRYFGPINMDCVQGVVENIVPDGSVLNDILAWVLGFE